MSVEILRPTLINNTIVGFVQQPDGRGTLSILFSCLLTLSLCVWSAVHLDLPEYGESQAHYTCSYLRWSALGVFGPELVIWTAWRQYISARALIKFMQETDDAEKRTAVKREWTMVHSFYAGMGGFVFDLTAPDMAGRTSFVPRQRRLHVTPRGIRLLARCGLLPDITREEIMDKSKADASGKLICCVQVAWMLVQSVTRLAVGLSITPLEINTIGHVLCALMSYLLWWHKPRWVKEPTVLRGDWVRPMCALMYMSSQVSAEHRPNHDLLRNYGVRSELSGVLYVAGDTETSQMRDKLSAEVNVTSIQAKSTAPTTHALSAVSSNSSAADNPTPTVGGHMVARSHPDGDALPYASSVSAIEHPESVARAEMQQRRWQYACEAIERYPAIRERLQTQERSAEEQKYREALQLYPEMPESVRQRFKSREPESGPEEVSQVLMGGLVCASEELVVDRPRNWPGDDLIRNVQGHLMGMIMWSTSTIYGAVHLAGWNEQFPTSIETWFWRGSAAYLIFSGLLWSGLNLLGHLFVSVWLYWYDMLAGDVRRRSYTVIRFLCGIGGSLYVVARTYLVVEALISLRALPESAYMSPSWILTVPHL